MLKIHYLCGDKDNSGVRLAKACLVVICSKFITFAVTKTTSSLLPGTNTCCDLLKIHYLCGDKDNIPTNNIKPVPVVICSKFITFAVTKTTSSLLFSKLIRCDLLKIHYLCGDKDNTACSPEGLWCVVICSKFITFAVTKTT